MRRDLALMLGLALTACAQAEAYQPQVDLVGVDPGRYAEDIRGCRNYAEQQQYGMPISPVYGRMIAGGMVGASLGAGLGIVLGWLFGATNIGLATSYGAESGGVAGTALAGATTPPVPDPQGPLVEKDAVDRCLRNNGYRLLD